MIGRLEAQRVQAWPPFQIGPLLSRRAQQRKCRRAADQRDPSLPGFEITRRPSARQIFTSSRVRHTSRPQLPEIAEQPFRSKVKRMIVGHAEKPKAGPLELIKYVSRGPHVGAPAHRSSG